MCEHASSHQSRTKNDIISASTTKGHGIVIYKYTADEAFLARACKKCHGPMEPSILSVQLAEEMFVVAWNCEWCISQELKKQFEGESK
jgi:hypothetical protein